MSFILDALKKSEAERQRKSTPGVADIPDAHPQSRTPRWLWAVGALLAVNLGVLVVILLRPGAETEPASITRPLELPDSAPRASFSDLVAEAKESQREAQTMTPPAEADPAPSREPAPEAAAPAAQPQPQSQPRPRREPVDVGTLSTFNELRARGDLMLPDLHLDLHVYADRPAERFIVINLNRYSEGEALVEGPVVERILPNGVMMKHQGTEFFLPRQ